VYRVRVFLQGIVMDIMDKHDAVALQTKSGKIVCTQCLMDKTATAPPRIGSSPAIKWPMTSTASISVTSAGIRFNLDALLIPPPGIWAEVATLAEDVFDRLC